MSRSKYGAVRTTIDGITFASKAEARHYAELKLREKAGEIRELVLQPKFPLHAHYQHDPHKPILVGNYIADFRYREGPKGILKIEDVKGMKTAMYRWKKKHVEAQYGIKITEIA